LRVCMCVCVCVFAKVDTAMNYVQT
jgi:hypothetical protein